MRTPLAALTLILVVALICGCGSSARAGGGGGAGGGSEHVKALKFAECMRSNGVSGFPDPGPSGSFTLDGIVNGSSLNPSSPAWRHAIAACKGLEPSGFTGHKRSAQQQVAAREFAQCIRQNGVPDFPDPTPNAPLVDTNLIPSAATSSGLSILNAAMHKCGATYAGALGLRR